MLLLLHIYSQSSINNFIHPNNSNPILPSTQTYPIHRCWLQSSHMQKISCLPFRCRCLFKISYRIFMCMRCRWLMGVMMRLSSCILALKSMGVVGIRLQRVVSGIFVRSFFMSRFGREFETQICRIFLRFPIHYCCNWAMLIIKLPSIPITS